MLLLTLLLRAHPGVVEIIDLSQLPLAPTNAQPETPTVGSLTNID